MYRLSVKRYYAESYQFAFKNTTQPSAGYPGRSRRDERRRTDYDDANRFSRAPGDPRNTDVGDREYPAETESRPRVAASKAGRTPTVVGT